MTLKHNKKKNSLIVYEQLLTLATRLAANKKLDEFNFVLEVIKSFYSPHSNIGKEKKVLQNITEAHLTKEDEREALLSECLKEYERIDQKSLELEKMALINHVSRKIGAELFKLPIKNYKLYASAQIYFNEHSNGFKNSEPSERIKIRTILKENLAKSKDKEVLEEMDNFTYKILINKFNEKYGPFINENQKDILKAWTKSLVSEDKTEIKSVISQKINLIESVVSKSLREKNAKTTEYYELLIEAKQALAEKKNRVEEVLTEEFVYEIMRYCDVVEDLKNGNQ